MTLFVPSLVLWIIPLLLAKVDVGGFSVLWGLALSLFEPLASWWRDPVVSHPIKTQILQITREHVCCVLVWREGCGWVSSSRLTTAGLKNILRACGCGVVPCSRRFSDSLDFVFDMYDRSHFQCGRGLRRLQLAQVVEWLFAPRKTSIVDTTDRHGALGKDFAHPETVDGLSLSSMKGKATLLFYSFMEASESRIGGPECCAYSHPCFISPSQFVTYNKVIRAMFGFTSPHECVTQASSTPGRCALPCSRFTSSRLCQKYCVSEAGHP